MRRSELQYVLCPIDGHTAAVIRIQGIFIEVFL